MDNPIQPVKQSSEFDVQEAQAANSHVRINTEEPICLSAEIDNYNSLLKNYQADLYRWLSNANHFEQFEQRVSEEVGQFGLSNWFFTQLGDLTKQSESEQVRYRSHDMGDTFAQVFAECDLILQHARECDRPVYQSQIESYVRGAPFTTELMERYLLLLAMIKQQGYVDLYCIPVVNVISDNRSVFCVSSKGMNSLDFIDRTDESKEMLNILGKVINDVGMLKYPGCFVDVRSRYKQLIKLQPFNLLAAMINYDLNEDEKRSGLSFHSTITYFTKIRSKLLRRSKK